MNENLHIFSQRLKDERSYRGLSQQQMAKLLQISYGTYKNYELLGTKNGRQPSFDILCRIAKVLEVSTDYLLGLIN